MGSYCLPFRPRNNRSSAQKSRIRTTNHDHINRSNHRINSGIFSNSSYHGRTSSTWRNKTGWSDSLEAGHASPPHKLERRYLPAPFVVEGLGGAGQPTYVRRRLSGSLEPISPSLCVSTLALSKNFTSPKGLEKVKNLIVSLADTSCTSLPSAGSRSD